MVVFAVEIESLSVVGEGMDQGVEPQDVEVAEGGKENESGFRVAIEETVVTEEGGEPDVVGILLIPPVVVENMPVGGVQRVAVASV